MNALPRSSWLLTVEEFLAFEEQSDVRHAYVGGEIHALVGASVRHDEIVGNIYFRLREASRARGCRLVTSDVKLQVAEDVIYYSDVILSCDPDDRAPYVLHKPLFVAEMPSPTTSVVDRREKARLYLQVPTLLSYLIAYQDEMRVDFYWRSRPDDEWHFDVRFDGSVTIPGIDLRLPLNEIYDGIDFDATSGEPGGGGAASI